MAVQKSTSALMVQMGKDAGNGAPGSMDRQQKLKVAA